MTYFVPTKDNAAERYKASIKNHNYPILAHMYHGSKKADLSCLMSGAPSFLPYKCLTRQKDQLQFNIEFNHIRQEMFEGKKTCPGNSKDKLSHSPSHLIRTKRLDQNTQVLVEFMTMIPVSLVEHKRITVASYYGNITLKDYTRAQWPWILRRRRNFDNFCQKYELKIQYDEFIEFLSDIEYAPVIYQHSFGKWGY